MRHGPAPKPTALKKLAGNPGEHRLNEKEPKPMVPKRVPYAPRFLNKEAQVEWKKMATCLLRIGLFTEVDHTALAMYCWAVGRWVDADSQLKVTGGEVITGPNGGLYQNPWLSVANKAFEQVCKLLSEFGLTPSSRSRLKVELNEEPSLADMLFDLSKDK